VVCEYHHILSPINFFNPQSKSFNNGLSSSANSGKRNIFFLELGFAASASEHLKVRNYWPENDQNYLLIKASAVHPGVFFG
jgi:hypothetical protein